MKVKKGVIGFVIAMAVTGCYFNSFAASNVNRDNSGNEVESRLLLPQIIRSPVIYRNRSWYMAECSAGITNNLDGTIGVDAQTYFHQPMAESYIDLSVQKLVGSGEDLTWVTVWRGSYEKFPEEDPSGTLYDMELELIVRGQPVNHYYRVQAVHSYMSLTGEMEMQSGTSNGIFLTNIFN